MLKVRNSGLYFENLATWGLVWGCPLLVGQIYPQDVLWRLFGITAAIRAMFSWDSFVFSSDTPPSCPTPPAPPNPPCPDSQLLLQFQGQILLGVPADWKRVCILPWRGERTKQQEQKFQKWQNIAFGGTILSKEAIVPNLLQFWLASIKNGVSYKVSDEKRTN